MENEKILNEIPESDLNSVSGGVNWRVHYMVGRIVMVHRSGSTSEQPARIIRDYGDDTYLVELSNGSKAHINFHREIID